MKSDLDSRSEGPAKPPSSMTESLAFIARAGAWALLLFGLVRVPWIQHNLLLPFAGIQGRIGCALVGTEPSSVFVGLSCTGADPMALVLASVLAFPTSWRARVKGASIGFALILGLNTLRIGTLSLVVGRRELFNALHVYIWPAVLIIAAAVYVFHWMGSAPRVMTETRATEAKTSFSRPIAIRFLALLVLLVIGFFAISPWLMNSSAVLQVARWATLSAAAVMLALGVSAEVTGNLLRTPQGSWMVTQACVATPLLPVYLAAVLSLPISVGRRLAGAAAALPLFMALGSARLLVLAIPAALVGSHSIAIHAFYQVLAATLVVAWAAFRSPNRLATFARAFGAGIACAFLIGQASRWWLWPTAERLRDSLHLGHAWVDAQGALSIMAPFQIGLFVALWLALERSLRDRGLLLGLGLLVAFQAGALVLLGELAIHTAISTPIAALRAASLALPLVIIWWTVSSGRVAVAPPAGADAVVEPVTTRASGLV